MRKYLFGAAIFMVFPLLGAFAQAATISIEVLTTFDYPGATKTYPYAINDRNEIAGFFSSSSRSSGFTRTADGQFSAPIIDPDDTHNLTGAFGLNDAGTVCGYFFGATDYHGFFLSGGSYAQFDVPGSSGTVLQGINDVGDFAGYYYNQANAVEGFVSVGGAVTTIDVPGGYYVTPHQLNAANQVVGYYVNTTSGFSYGFYSTPAGTLKYPVAAPGSLTTYLYGINDRGWMVGKFYDHSRLGHGLFFIPPNQFVTFDYASSPVVTLSGINHKGFICGYYEVGNSVHGLVARVRRTAE